ncbi:MAG: pantetheine-phosphate adenylyltransferase [Defluviitaleaceae bacterium]|nr:pantetheine-phosphate adenylyltransferase [Defluviitaleaceae bacterium]
MSAIYPGSFDPVTYGHIDIARRSAKVFGRIIVAVLDNPDKTPLFDINERMALLREAFSQDTNIEVESFSGLLVDYAQQKGIGTIVRGLRGSEDIAKEMPYAIWNRKLSTELAIPVETVYFTAEPDLAHISSSIVKEVAAFVYPAGMSDTEITQAVPPIVCTALREKYI